MGGPKRLEVQALQRNPTKQPSSVLLNLPLPRPFLPQQSWDVLGERLDGWIDNVLKFAKGFHSFLCAGRIHQYVEGQ